MPLKRQNRLYVQDSKKHLKIFINFAQTKKHIMNLSTKITIKPSDKKIGYTDTILSIGSCFSENIGAKLQNGGFNITINPFGVLFNPISIYDCLLQIVNGKDFGPSDLFENEGLWGSFAHSTLFSDLDSEKCLININSHFSDALKNFKQTNIIFITFGTAYAYQLKKTGKIVANCHKLPTQNFERIRLSVDEIVSVYAQLHQILYKLKPDLQLVFAVSPVRHLSDGATENHISKGVLLQAISEITQTLPGTSYFPSYEIVMDELRDYRFYANDMVHPSDVAVDFIFEKFKDTFFSSETTQILEKVIQYRNAQLHRPFRTDTPTYKKFIEHTEKLKSELTQKYRLNL